MSQIILNKNSSYYFNLPTNKENLDKIKSIINIINKQFYINTVRVDRKLNISLNTLLDNYELYIKKSKKRGISEYSNIHFIINVAFDNIGGDTVAYISNDIFNFDFYSCIILNPEDILNNNFICGF